MATATKRRIGNLRDHILTAAKLPEELVHVSEWDEGDTECVVLVRSMTARERADFMRRILAPTMGQRGPQLAGAPTAINWENYFVDIVQMTARDPEDGALLFEPTHRDSLLAMAAAPIERLASVARRLSGLEESSAAAQAEFPDSDD